MVLTMFLEALGCYTNYLIDAWEASTDYTACIGAAAGTGQVTECFFAYVLGAGDAATRFFGCFS
jgi:hypothetical protein